MAEPKVLYVIDSLAPGGAERSLAEIGPHLVNRGIKLEVAVLHERPGFTEELENAGIRVTLIRGSTRTLWLRELRRHINRSRPDLIHTTLFDADQIGRLAGALTRTPIVSSLVSLTWGDSQYLQPDVAKAKVQLARLLDLTTARLVRRFHAVSLTVAEEMSSRLHIPRRKIVVITRGRDPERLGRRTPQRRFAARTSLSIQGDVTLLVCLARHESEKRLDTLIRAMPNIREGVPAAHLLIAGREGRQTNRIKELISALDLESVVRLLGIYEPIPDLLCAGDLFVLPTMREGLPGSVVEALALELPIVVSDIPAVREVVDESTATLMPIGGPTDLARRVVAAIRDPTELRARAAAGRVRFERDFTIQASADKWNHFYRELAEH